MLTLIRGAGELASGIALRLRRVGIDVVMTERETPTTIRRTAAFACAVTSDEMTVENVTARRALNASAARELLSRGILPVLVDPEARCLKTLRPAMLVDAICAGRNLGTSISDARVVIGVGAGFTAGVDCHAVIDAAPGHPLGRVYYKGGATPWPDAYGAMDGDIEGVLCAPADGAFMGTRRIGDVVGAGDTVGVVAGEPMTASCSGVLLGLLADGVAVTRGMKAAEVSPHGKVEHCYSVSGCALAVGGGVLEALLKLGAER